MHIFLCWRPMNDHVGLLGHAIERCLWGDGRARHTFLMVSTTEHPLVLIEIDLGDGAKGIQKSMTLNVIDLDEVPSKIVKIEFLGKVTKPNGYEDLIQSARDYVRDHPNYNALFNNCRTFVEYLIDQIPEISSSVPRHNGSILEYYHYKAKHEHPGAIVKSKKFLDKVREQHRLYKISKIHGAFAASNDSIQDRYRE